LAVLRVIPDYSILRQEISPLPYGKTD